MLWEIWKFGFAPCSSLAPGFEWGNGGVSPLIQIAAPIFAVCCHHHFLLEIVVVESLPRARRSVILF